MDYFKDCVDSRYNVITAFEIVLVRFGDFKDDVKILSKGIVQFEIMLVKFVNHCAENAQCRTYKFL